MALGATRGKVIGYVLRRGLLLTGSGLALGAVASLALPRVIRWAMNDTLYAGGANVAKTGTLHAGAALAAACAAMACAAFVACYLPARRAAAIEPLEALRME
jgi:ABC-type lipoprotein release transport system permease subunit